ncbi:S-layer homology domain-containing protein, partial [Klebsiella pneumoniae]|nr:S-layer homology domain-containing protein [Klebsiella pneumoniae]
FYDAVLWAVDKGITNGVNATHFGPNSPCTREQVATFLYRALGKPDTKVLVSPFADVLDQESYSFTPILWAYENGVTNGMRANAFGSAAP